MTERYEIDFNGDTGGNHGVFLYDIPEITQAKRKYETYSIPGRDGELIEDDGSVGNVIVTCKFSVLSEEFRESIRDLKRWLSGPGKLKLSESQEYYYEVLLVEHAGIEREIRKYGRFTATFTCYPYEFHETGDIETDSKNLYNPYEMCNPVYKITGEGSCSLTVNGKTMQANIGQNLTIDTRRMLAYRIDGTPTNTAVKGDYEDLRLKHGANNISITAGFSLVTIPHWGCKA